jgi:glycine dehydrogenase subunit 1
VHLTWLGPEGLEKLGLLCARKAHYLRGRLLEIPGVTAFTPGPVVREFALRLSRPAAEVVDALVPAGYLAGVPAGGVAGRLPATAAEAGDLEDVLLVAVTERRTRAQLDAFSDAMKSLLSGGEVTP